MIQRHANDAHEYEYDHEQEAANEESEGQR